MTNQEAIKIIEDECEHIKSHLKCKGKAEEYYKELGDMCIAFYMAIKALEQEPSGDLISRQAVNILVDELARAISDERCCMSRGRSTATIMQDILDLPSVNPQEPKTGHWIEKDGFDGDVYYDCSECGESWTTIEGTPWQNEMNYCPNCGAKMESEDK